MDWPEVHRRRMHRHLLTTGERPDPAAVAHRVGGLQAQVASVPVLSVRARGGTDDWSGLVRMWTLRGTIHLVRAADAHLFAAALGKATAARETRLWPRQGVPAGEEDKVTDAIIDVLGDGPARRAAIAERVGVMLGPSYKVLLEHPWGIGFKPAVARGRIRMEGAGADVTFRLPDRADAQQLGAVAPDAAQQWLARVYLTANIAGDAASFARWTGLGRAPARKALEAAADGKLTVADRSYLTAAGFEPSGDDSSAVLLPAFDPFTLAVMDKDGFCPPGTADLVYRKGGWVSSIVVYRGLPVATVTLKGTSITVEPFTGLSASARKAVDAVAYLIRKSNV